MFITLTCYSASGDQYDPPFYAISLQEYSEGILIFTNILSVCKLKIIPFWPWHHSMRLQSSLQPVTVSTKMELWWISIGITLYYN